jgi:hypothetical protein
MSTAAAFEDVHRDAEYFEYSEAADPIGLKLISRVPYHDFPASLYTGGPTRVIALDLSKEASITRRPALACSPISCGSCAATSKA